MLWTNALSELEGWVSHVSLARSPALAGPISLLAMLRQRLRPEGYSAIVVLLPSSGGLLFGAFQGIHDTIVGHVLV